MCVCVCIRYIATYTNKRASNVIRYGPARSARFYVNSFCGGIVFHPRYSPMRVVWISAMHLAVTRMWFLLYSIGSSWVRERELDAEDYVNMTWIQYKLEPFMGMNRDIQKQPVAGLWVLNQSIAWQARERYSACLAWWYWNEIPFNQQQKTCCWHCQPDMERELFHINSTWKDYSADSLFYAYPAIVCF